MDEDKNLQPLQPDESTEPELDERLITLRRWS